ncbi:BglII/BstYI family type II restriction endonuclease [Paenibacillus ferrarius]|uniref:BglII/BstYI family type II restriction endonuclease n=1 Tax=Paenibacillus ferrarius TaxID=1469647 RepID=UPI003D2BFFCB
MKIRLEVFSFRFAEQILNSKLSIKQEIEKIITDPTIVLSSLSRPILNKELDDRFTNLGWERQPAVFEEDGDPSAKMDFLKDRIGIEVEFGHSSFIGIDLLKFQIASYSGLNRIDCGVYVVTTKNFQKQMTKQFNQNWEGSLNFEKVVRYLPHFKSAIQVPVYVIGIDLG